MFILTAKFTYLAKLASFARKQNSERDEWDFGDLGDIEVYILISSVYFKPMCMQTYS